MTRLVPLLAAVVLAAGLVPAAVADGDPASDYLIAKSTFVSLDHRPDKNKSDELTALLAASKTAGFELRVAVIATAYDLGSVPVLYRKPDQYARFLGQELFYWYKGELLIVMPNGYGLYHHGAAPPAADLHVLATLPVPETTDGNELVTAASGAVRALAVRRGISLPQAAVSDSSTGNDRILIAVGALVALALAVVLLLFRRRRSRRT